MQLKTTLKHIIQKEGKIKKGSLVLCGVSGGADSVTLLHILNSLRHEIGFSLRTTHFNHHLRRGSNADQTFVESLAKKMNIPIDVGHWDHKLINKSEKNFNEEGARIKRFSFFKTIYKKHHANVLVLGHHQNDLAETILMKIIRGSGTKGLRGILHFRNIKNMNILRPMLNINRSDILKYIKENSLKHREYPTNLDETIFRNRIRHQLLPLLESKYNSQIHSNLVNLANINSTDYDFLEKQSHRIFSTAAEIRKGISPLVKFELRNFLKKHIAIQRMLIRQAFEHIIGNQNSLSLTHLLEIEDLCVNRPIGSKVSLPKKVFAEKSKSFLIIKKI